MLDQNIPTVPILALPENIMLRTFGSEVMRFGGWTYFTNHDTTGRIEHYAVFENRIELMDFTPFEVMPREVFKWMVQLDFPHRRDLAQSSKFRLFCGSPLSSSDVERIWQWHQLNDSARTCPPG